MPEFDLDAIVPTMLTDAEAAAIRARRAAITPPPWTWAGIRAMHLHNGGTWVLTTALRGERGNLSIRATDKAFIAAAPTDIDALLADRAALVARIRELEAQLADYETPCEAHTDAEGRIIGPGTIPPYEG